mmetsp:Transcript_23829/g.52227  ORF Transcript_23829/g.52227 Transcript_23829/m.52227 type:complete len:100 (+) Transcript_23829:206-505(+)|eukprot:CAMPEP_0202890742 /NCGR_PEP_ID=MMETSP1392-20130828/1051_1 /ASSEMBLY_ACC=CAM_ASM_000868 /TAXON_ID=225041 /ORGANISM="Chlamydomonas chlamydogama, Strain SAG 11-48b" /LENGTH=99 /DNA_ID=CAMNT_0049574367 /DNA_START=169 /DNA_END=468 /DNA_ORIENTATION=-
MASLAANELLYEARLLQRYFGAAVTSKPVAVPSGPSSMVHLSGSDNANKGQQGLLANVHGSASPALTPPPASTVRFLSMFGHKNVAHRVNSLLREALAP